MASGLNIRFWFNDALDPASRLLSLAKLLHSMSSGDRWNGIHIHDSNVGQPVLESSETLVFEQLTGMLNRYRGSTLHLSAVTAMPCWRLKNGNPMQGHIPVWVQAWGSDYSSLYGRRPEMEGDALISFATSAPFITAIPQARRADIEHVNSSIEKNLDLLLTIVLENIKTGCPRSIKVFTEEGMEQPLNSHLIYFDNPAVVIKDLVFVKELWDVGLPAYHMQPVRDSLTTLDRTTLHGWRTVEAAASLCRQLQKNIDSVTYLTPAHIEQVQWQKYNKLESDHGFGLYKGRLWVNNFMDDFYIDVLEVAQQQ